MQPTFFSYQANDDTRESKPGENKIWILTTHNCHIYEKIALQLNKEALQKIYIDLTILVKITTATNMSRICFFANGDWLTSNNGLTLSNENLKFNGYQCWANILTLLPEIIYRHTQGADIAYVYSQDVHIFCAFYEDLWFYVIKFKCIPLKTLLSLYFLLGVPLLKNAEKR